VSDADRGEIDAYLRHLGKERRLSPHTSSNYARDIGALADFLERGNVNEWKRVDSQHVRVFAARAHAGGLSPRSVQRRLSAVRSFFTFLAREGVVAGNPAVDIRAPKAAKRLPGTLDVDQITQLLQVPGDDPLAVRDRAIMELFYSSGLRLAELVGLDLTHIDLADRTVRVLGKGAKTRIVPVGRKACEGRARLAERARGAGRHRRDRAVRGAQWRASQAARHPAAHRPMGAPRRPAEPRLSAPFPAFLRDSSS
jgi:integrase/recombinase XerC